MGGSSNSADILHPLNKLLQRNAKWAWSKECSESFNLANEKLVSTEVLAHYDPALELRLAADASAYGVGAVQNYAQVEKEALSLILESRDSTPTPMLTTSH